MEETPFGKGGFSRRELLKRGNGRSRSGPEGCETRFVELRGSTVG